MNLEQVFASFKKLTSALSTTQLISIAVAFFGVLAVLGASAYWINKPDFVLLADGLDPESASAVVAKLKAAKVSYELDNGGRSIRVPSERVDELRLQVASDGFPSAGRIGFELFDKASFGTTDAQEHVNYQRALQGELERTISTLSDVASARVHLTMAKDSLYSDQSQSAKASVVLRLKSNRPLSDATVRGIAGLVSNSVESLRPESVAILDTYGRLLSRPEEDGAGNAGLQPDRQQQLERDLSTRVVALLEPVVGPGHVRVNVSARLKADAEEETEERWDPTTVVRSRQTSVEADTRAMSQGSVAGARSNLPDASPAKPAPSPAPMMNGTNRNSETTNYEVSKLTRHRLSPQGQLARLSVAVIVDDDHTAKGPGKGEPRKPEEIQRIEKIVAAAVGFDQTRGDQLTVENMAFDAPADDTPVALSGWPAWKQTLTDAGREYGMPAFRTVSVLLLAMAVIFGVLRPMSRRAMVLQREVAMLPERQRVSQELPAMSVAPGLPAEPVP
ncbi:MAG: flagellar M-ring protein FliF, partial [Acidobacteria bacterium 37-65-4]